MGMDIIIGIAAGVGVFTGLAVILVMKCFKPAEPNPEPEYMAKYRCDMTMEELDALSRECWR